MKQYISYVGKIIPDYVHLIYREYHIHVYRASCESAYRYQERSFSLEPHFVKSLINMKSFRTLLAFLIVALVSGAGFVPRTTPSDSRISKTTVNFGFLKQLGLEKPDWLPDFGGKKVEEEAPKAAVSEDDAEAPKEVAAEE